LNKRQSAIDRRLNEVEKMYSQQMDELQRIAQMPLEEARQVVLAEAEKEGRNDMARIIRQIEAEARQKAKNAPAKSSRMPSSGWPQSTFPR
jgi:ribonucrease Y